MIDLEIFDDNNEEYDVIINDVLSDIRHCEKKVSYAIFRNNAKDILLWGKAESGYLTDLIEHLTMMKEQIDEITQYYEEQNSKG